MNRNNVSAECAHDFCSQCTFEDCACVCHLAELLRFKTAEIQNAGFFRDRAWYEENDLRKGGNTMQVYIIKDALGKLERTYYSRYHAEQTLRALNLNEATHYALYYGSKRFSLTETKA